MPSSTVFGAEFTNLGSVVTTFTPAPSCTAISNLAIGMQNSDTSMHILGYPGCDPFSYAGCVPHGSQVQSLVDNFVITDADQYFTYYSPGLVCPSGWTTAGTIVGPSGWSGASGVFTEGHFPYVPVDYPFPDAPGPIDQYVMALEASETLAWCCPSGMAPLPRAMGCGSSVMPLRSYSAYSGVCYIEAARRDIFATVTTYDGSVYTNGILSPAPHTGPISFTTTFVDVEPSADTDLNLVTIAGAVMLIHKEEDLHLSTTTASMPKGDGGDSEQGNDKGDGGGDGEGDGESTARRLQPTSDGLWAILPVAVTAGTVFLTMVLL